MNKQIFIFAVLLNILISFEIIAQKVETERNRSVITIPEKTSEAVLDPLPAGTYSIGTGGYFPTIDSAFNKLSIDGISGAVTLELIDNFYQAQNEGYFLLNGPIAGASESNRILIRPAENKNVIVEGNGYDVFFFYNTSYITLDGISLTGNTTLTVKSILNNNVLPAAIDFEDDCDYNVVQNVTVIVEDYIEGWGISIWVFDPTLDKSPDHNIIQNNLIKSAGIGIIVAGNSDSTTVVPRVVRPIGNIIRNNKVGTATDSLIAWGIQTERSKGTIIENNEVQNVRYYNNYTNPPINAYYSNDCIIRNNIVHNATGSSNIGTRGITLSGTSNEMGDNNLIYNNFIYDIRCTSNYGSARLAGIQLWYQNNPKIYYNSVLLDGKGSTPAGSAALFVDYISNNVVSKNNILVNIRDESPYCASSIFVRSGSTISSDYNDLQYDDTNANNCLVRIGGTNYNTLGDWQATGKDLHSITEMPNFIAPDDLHINNLIATNIESRGTPISGIDTDFDGDTRNTSTPDIGADEFNGIAVGVENEGTLPSEFSLSQNYPNPFNPSTIISWQSPVGGNQTLKVFDVLGNEVAVLVDEFRQAGRYEIEFDAENLTSGVYFYRLHSGDPSTGSGQVFVQTRKMLLLK